MPRVPQIAKFRGDNETSIQRWILQFEAQLQGLGIKDENKSWRNLLLCYMDENAFTVASNAITADSSLSYDGLKKVLKERFSGQDYQRALESKLRSLKFRKGMKIPAFVHELKTSIQELYGLKDDKSVESIAINHLMANLEDSLKAEVKILQLTGNLKLENLLELIETKLEGHPFGASAMKTDTPRHTERVYNRSYTDERLDKLENMMSSVLARVGNDKAEAQESPRQRICDNCQKVGHVKAQCNKLKTCYKCNKKGHIAKFCRSSNQQDTSGQPNGANTVNSSAGETTQRESENANQVKLQAVPRIMIFVEMGGKQVEMLYDPGSTYCMITRATYESLRLKPPLSSVSNAGISVSGENFEFDGVVYLNLKFKGVDGGDYTLEYQPVLVSSRITSNILGIYTEMQFKGTVRDQENESIIFMPKDTKSGITVRYYKEKLSQNSACVRIAKATVVPVKSMRMVQSNIRGSMQDGKETSSFVFDPLEMQNEDMEIADLVMDKVTKHMRIPIYNDSEEEIMLKKGEIIGFINPVEADTYDADPVTMDGIAASSSDTSPTDGVLDEKLRHLDMETSREVKKIIAEYELKLKESKNAGVKLDVEHHFTLKDDIPVSAPARRIPYSQREEINKQIEDLLERDVIEETRSAFGAPIVTVKKRDGSFSLCVDYRRLNAKTIATPFPIPRIDELLDKLKGSRYFTHVFVLVK